RCNLRHEILLPALLGQWPQVLVQHGTIGTYQERLRRAVNTPVDPDLAVGIKRRSHVRVSQLLQPENRLFAVVAPVEAVDRDFFARGQRQEKIVLVTATDAPGRPDVHQRHLSLVILAADSSGGIFHAWQRKRRRRLAEVRRRHGGRIALQANEKNRDQDSQRDDRHEVAKPHTGLSARALRRSRTTTLTRYRLSLAAITPPSAITRAPSQMKTIIGLYC